MHCQCFQQLGILFKPWTKFARLFFFSCQWNFSIRYRQGMTWLSFSLFYYTDVMYLPLTMRTKLTAWLDLTILKESLTAALTLFLFFSTNFSIAVWNLFLSFIVPSYLTLSFRLLCFGSRPFHWILYWRLYIWVPQSESEDHGDIMIRCSMIPKMLVSQIKNDQALLTLYRERWLKSSGP